MHRHKIGSDPIFHPVFPLVAPSIMWGEYAGFWRKNQGLTGIFLPGNFFPRKSKNQSGTNYSFSS
jgi:hypothetical protein